LVSAFDVLPSPLNRSETESGSHMDKVLSLLLEARLFFQQSRTSPTPYALEILFVWESLENAIKFSCYEKTGKNIFKNCGATCYREEADRMQCDDCHFNVSGFDNAAGNQARPKREHNDCSIIELLRDALREMEKGQNRSFDLAIGYLQRAIVGAEKLARLQAISCDEHDSYKSPPCKIE